MQSDAQLKKMIQRIDKGNRIGLKGAHDACLSASRHKLDDISCKTLRSDVLDYIETKNRIQSLVSEQRELRYKEIDCLNNDWLDCLNTLAKYREGLEEKLEVERQRIGEKNSELEETYGMFAMH